MALELPHGEPHAGPWRTAPVEDLVTLLCDVRHASPGRPRVVAIDGRSGSGKTTLANQLHRAVPAAAVVHTDDVAFHHSFFDWGDLLRFGILEPLRRGETVRYRPPGWDVTGRPGAIEVLAGLDMVFVEGVGAGRRELTDVLEAVVWVQSDFGEAERRGLERDVASGANGNAAAATAFWKGWMAQELRFVAAQRPWERAVAITMGTHDVAH